VRVGSEVTIVEDGTSDEETYMIVGAAEANPREGKISQRSPIGAALLGHKKGEKVRVQTPAGEVVFKIKKIS
jgi:transcription elongation factor GreA